MIAGVRLELTNFAFLVLCTTLEASCLKTRFWSQSQLLSLDDVFTDADSLNFDFLIMKYIQCLINKFVFIENL